MIEHLYYSEETASYYALCDVYDCDVLILPDGRLCCYDGRNAICAVVGSLFYLDGNRLIKSVLEIK